MRRVELNEWWSTSWHVATSAVLVAGSTMTAVSHAQIGLVLPLTAMFVCYLCYHLSPSSLAWSKTNRTVVIALVWALLGDMLVYRFLDGVFETCGMAVTSGAWSAFSCLIATVLEPAETKMVIDGLSNAGAN